MNIGDDLRHQFVRLSYSPEIMSMEFTREEMTTIYDYIKDKEQEIEILKENNENMQIEMASCWEKIDKAIEYIEHNDLYYQDVDYDYEENMELLPPSDEIAKRDLLEILKGEDNE